MDTVMKQPSPGFRLSDLLDHYIPAEMQANAGWHRRARMFMLSHLFGPVLGMSIPLYMYFTGIARDSRVAVFLLSILAFWVYPTLLRRTGRYELLAFISVQNLIFCVLWACYAFGGMTSPFLPWMLIFPLLAFLYLPPEGRVRNILLIQIFGSTLSFIVLCLLGLPLPDVDLKGLQTIGMISMASVAIYFAMMSLYFARMYREQGQFARELNSLVSTSDNLRDLTAAATQASMAKADFVAGMSHELRTPLNAIIGYSQLLMEEARDEGDQTTVADIGHVHDAGTHLLGLIDDILTYSRLEAGKLPFNPALGTLDSRMPAWTTGSRVEDLTDRVVVLPPWGPDIGVSLDWTLVANIVQHVIVDVAAQQPTARVVIAPGLDDAWLTITFEAKGKDGAALPLALNVELFEHGDDASSSKYGRSGIELPLAYKLATSLDGTIRRDAANPNALSLVLPLEGAHRKLAA